MIEHELERPASKVIDEGSRGAGMYWILRVDAVLIPSTYLKLGCMDS